MPKPFDATLKELIEAYPADWLAAVGVPITGPVEVVSAELSTVTAAADALIRVGDVVVHIDAESGPDPSLATRMLLYNVLAHRETGSPVHSVAVLLRPNANPGGLVPEVRYSVSPAGELTFRFEVMRVWETPTEELLTRGIGLLPLAVLGRVPPGQTRKQALPGVLEQIAARAVREAPREHLQQVVIAAIILSGMYLEPSEIKRIVQRFPAMIQSSAYAVFEEMGEIKHAKSMLLAQGRVKFGEPTPEQEQALRAIDDLDRLNRMTLAVLKVRSWAALLRTK